MDRCSAAIALLSVDGADGGVGPSSVAPLSGARSSGEGRLFTITDLVFKIE
jgi:hypothetical protein